MNTIVADVECNGVISKYDFIRIIRDELYDANGNQVIDELAGFFDGL